MTLLDEYFENTKKFMASHGPKTIVLIQVGSFFEVYGILHPDGNYKGALLKEFARINDMVIASKNTCVGQYDVYMAGFGVAHLDKYVKKLLSNGYTVPVYIQDIQGKNTTRSLMHIYSPGTYFNSNDSYDDFDENNYNNGLSNNTLCLWVHKTKSLLNKNNEMLYIGLSIIDILTGKLINYEYNVEYIDSPTIYDELEKYFSIYNPSETIIITNNVNDYDGKYIDILINYINIYSSKIHKVYLKKDDGLLNTEFIKNAYSIEKQTIQESIIDRTYGVGSYLEKNEFRDYNFANQSLCFLLDFIYKHNPSLIKDIDYPVFENHSNKLILANHSLKQLNMISDGRNNSKFSCVANLLNNCVTNGGKRKFNYELLHPICDVNILNKSYNNIEDLLKTKFYETIRNDLQNVRDTEKISRKLIIKCINPKDIFLLYNNLSKVKELFFKISTKKENKSFLEFIKSYLDFDISKICNAINNFIDEKFNLEEASNIIMEKIHNYELNKLNFINKKVNKDLNKLFKNSIDSKQQLIAISQFLSSIVSDFEKPKNNKSKSLSKNNKKSNISQKNEQANEDNNIEDYNNYVKIHETSKNDPILLITKRRSIILKEILDKIIKENGKDYIINYNSSYSGSEEQLTIDLTSISFKPHGSNQANMSIESNFFNNIAHNIQNSRDILINAITYNYNKIIEDFHKFDLENNYLSTISRFISLIDVSQSKAYNAFKYNYTKPTIFDNDYGQLQIPKSYVRFKQMRHALIEHINNKELYVTNDLSIGESYNGMLLYGTNAVGKTSFIKSIGIALIMAQSGMYVPCSEFIYYPYNYLFTRILGNDNIFKGLSTFAVEMSELRTILKNATSNSIILGDELCSGTESSSALSIFTASLQKLHNLESTFLFATHFHEILEYDEIKELDKLKTYHMSVVFDRAKKTLIYDRKLKPGHGESMYGLEVCKSLDLPYDFIENAYAIRNKYVKNQPKLLETKKSRYNSKKIRDLCEICKLNISCEVHHLQFQKNANTKGIINNEFRKNHKANLINICEDCHLKIHESNTEYRVTKCSSGYELLEI